MNVYSLTHDLHVWHANIPCIPVAVAAAAAALLASPAAAAAAAAADWLRLRRWLKLTGESAHTHDVHNYNISAACFGAKLPTSHLGHCAGRT